MRKERDIKKIIALFVSILLVGVFLIGLVSTNKVIETISAKEDYAFVSYGAIRYYFEEFSELELDEETSETVVDLICGMISEINSKTSDDIDFAIYDMSADVFSASSEEDMLLSELIYSLDNESHKITKNYIYKNYIIGNYRFLLKIRYDGIDSIVFDEAFTKSIAYYVLGFVLLSIIVFFVFYFSSSNKFRKIVGLLVVILWISAISFNSAADLRKLQNTIIEEETDHLTTLISYYYKQDIIDQDITITDYRAWAEDTIYQFSISNDYIESISLNDRYDEKYSSISSCLDFTYNTKAINNKNLEFIISALSFLILAILIYDRLSNSILKGSNNREGSFLTKFDNKFLIISFLCMVGSSLTWSITLPRLLEIASGSFLNGGSNYVATIYSVGIAGSTIISVFASRINSAIKKTKYYCLAVYALLFAGLLFLGLSNNFVMACISYVLIYFHYGLVSVIPFFYSSSMDDERKNEFLICATNNGYIAQSIGIIVGGVLGSVLSYSYVLLIASGILLITIISLVMTKAGDYNEVSSKNTAKISIRGLWTKKKTFLFLLLIVSPLAFYATYTDYEFPIEILNLGLTTVIISFISMISRLVSAYTSNFLYKKLSKITSKAGMTYIYVLGLVSIMLVNSIKTSVVVIVIVSFVFGLLGAFGNLASRERLVEIASGENIKENDANVSFNLANKFGTTIGPSVITFCGSSIFLPIIMLVTFVIYFITSKRKNKSV